MASGSFIAVTPGAGAKLATSASYTENANVVLDEKVIPGEPYLATYWITAQGVSIATNNGHMLQIMAGASLKVRIKSYRIQQSSNFPATAFALPVQIIRLTSAGTGGTVVTPAPLNPADSASGATTMYVPTAKGTETTTLNRHTIELMTDVTYSAAAATASWQAGATGSQTPIIAAGAANGIAFKNLRADAAATVDIWVEIIETSF